MACAPQVTVVGASMGCAVIWSYIELFGEERLSQAVFVDQAPLQVSGKALPLQESFCWKLRIMKEAAMERQPSYAVFKGLCLGCYGSCCFDFAFP